MALPGEADEIGEEEARLSRRLLPALKFAGHLETDFERKTAKGRSYRMWLEGMLAIVLLNVCLLADYFLVQDPRWKAIILRTTIVTPLALLVNFVVRANPSRWLREGSVALGMTLICLINLSIEGNATAASTTFGLICVLISVSFTDLVMRIRLPYAGGSTLVMTVSALWFAAESTGLERSEKVVAVSLLAMGIAITMATSYSLEREERVTYLLQVRTEKQGENLSETNVRLRHLSTMDTLTELPNRRAFEGRLAELWAEGTVSGKPLSSVMLDVDQFKVLNDRGGHLYGDNLLRRIAGILPQGMRGPQDFVARYGGDEFLVLLPDTGIDDALGVAERMRVLVELLGTPTTGQFVGEEVLLCTVSCGVAMCVPSGNIVPEDLLRAADRALYDAKSTGANRVSSRGMAAHHAA